MTIKIVLPSGDGVRTGCGTKVYTESGDEVKNITRLNISIDPNDLITATLTIAVSHISGLDDILAHASFDTIEQLEKLGYKVQKDWQ